MIVSRRALLAGAGAGALFPRAALATTAALQRGLDAASRAGRPFALPPGDTIAGGLRIPDGAVLEAARGGSRLRLTGPLVAAPGARAIALHGLDLRALPGASAGGLVDFVDVPNLTIDSCRIADAPADAIRLARCGGRIRSSAVRGAGGSGLFALDSTGLSIEDNLFSGCGDNGVRIWRSARGHDGTRVVGNRILDIAARSGGTGQYGNGLSVFRAGGVLAQDNFVARCAFSALRNNSGARVIFRRNACSDLGETAIFAEFAWADAEIIENVVDGAVSGVQMVNFADHGGRGGRCVGNTLRGLRPPRDGGGRQWGYGAGVKVEAETLVSGNRIAGAPWVGRLVGWGPSLRDVTARDNDISGSPVGIGLSAAPGAGGARIIANRISGAGAGAIVALAWEKPVSGDLSRSGAGAFPQFTLAGNQVA